MYESLYRFLIKYKKIDLPGIGTIALQTQPAQSEFVSRSFLAPAYLFTLEKARLTASADTNEKNPVGQGKETQSKLFSWIAANNNINEREAVGQFNDFVFDLKKELESGKKITWSGVGIFQKEMSGEIKFEGKKKELQFLEEVVAKKVIRENAEHTMLVGEVEKTSTQMTEMLSGDMVIKEKRSYWWVWPLAVIIVILIFLGWYFSEHGTSSSTGNNHKISVSSP
jgi:hypothetical protein